MAETLFRPDFLESRLSDKDPSVLEMQLRSMPVGSKGRFFWAERRVAPQVIHDSSLSWPDLGLGAMTLCPCTD